MWRHTNGTAYEWLMNGTSIVASGAVGAPSATDWTLIA
jgi:hypothetical protein